MQNVLRKITPFGKKGGVQQSTGIYIVVLLIVAIGSIAIYQTGLFGNLGGIFAAAPVTGGTTVTTTGSSTTFQECITDPSARDLKAVVKNGLTATTTYLSIDTMYVKNANGISLLSDVGQGSSSGSTETNALVCGLAQDIYTQSNETMIGGLYKHLDAAQVKSDPVEVNDGTAIVFDNITVKFYDVSVAAFVYADQESITTATNDLTNSNGIVLIAGQDTYNTTGRTFYSSTQNTSKTIAASETLNYNFYVKTNSVDTQFGTNTIMCVDWQDQSNADDWRSQGPSVTFDGTSRTDLRGTLSTNDQLGVSGYESCYDLGVIRSTEKMGNIQFTPSSGVNPDYDPILWFIPGIVYQDDQQNTQLIGVDGKAYFRTDASRTTVNGPARAILSVA